MPGAWQYGFGGDHSETATCGHVLSRCFSVTMQKAYCCAVVSGGQTGSALGTEYMLMSSYRDIPVQVCRQAFRPVAMCRVLVAVVYLMAFVGCHSPESREVVVYTSVDQVYSEPILKEFERRSGIRVRAVYDVEASKTTGLINRIIAERDNPHCDVFWNSEFAGTIMLKKKGLLQRYISPSAQDIPEEFIDPDHFWTGFSVRAHVLVYNTRMLKGDDVPGSIFELSKPQWKARVALAYPLFGTTATFMAVLRVVLGPERAKQYITSLRDNKVLIVDGNAVARDLVVEGRVPLAFTDTDDVNVAKKAGRPVDMVYPDQQGIGTFLIPSTVALIKGGPHPTEARELVDYLLSKEVERKLAFMDAGQMPVRDDVERPGWVPDYRSFRTIRVDYSQVADAMPASLRFCQDVFAR